MINPFGASLSRKVHERVRVHPLSWSDIVFRDQFGMDIHLLEAECRRVSEEFRAKIALLALLRTQLVEAKTDKTRQHLYAAVDEEARLSRELSDKLLALEKAVHKAQLRETKRRLSPLSFAPLDF
jgi:hypothetical protein